MKEVTKYQCEICKHEYEEEARATACEASHILVSSVLGYKYNGYDEALSCKYPVLVTVQMADGQVLTFKR